MRTIRDGLSNGVKSWWRLSAVVSALAGVVAALGLTSSARAQDDFVSQANAGFKDVPQEKRSDLVLLPLLVKMQAAPGVLKSQEHAALLASQGPGWEACAEWAKGEAQQALLKAVAKVTEERDHRKAYVFAQPYGVEGVDLDMVSAGMYTELGETPTLAGAQIGFMDELETLGILCHVEASRLQKEGDAKGAMTVMSNWVFFTRQYMDRPFLKEKTWAMQSMLLALVRMRDIAYQDYRAEAHKLDTAYLTELLGKMPVDGYLSINRLRPPTADFLGREQLLARVLKKGGGADETVFGPTMAKITSNERPLRLFSASAYWSQVGQQHADLTASQKALRAIQGDWTKRWDLSEFDTMQQTKTDYLLRVRGHPELALVGFDMEPMEQLMKDRQRERTEFAGTRMSLAVYAYLLEHKSLPPALNSTRPAIVKVLDKDPYASARSDLVYWISGRENPKGADGQAQPYVIKMFPPEPYPSFEVPIPVGEFILFSIGPNNVAEGIREATQGREGVRGDYLLWPPALSLFRLREMEQGQLN